MAKTVVKYEDIEELDVEKFNRNVNLGINAEDMLEMINERYPVLTEKRKAAPST